MTSTILYLILIIILVLIIGLILLIITKEGVKSWKYLIKRDKKNQSKDYNID
jgi:uncharacterized membrane protein